MKRIVMVGVIALTGCTNNGDPDICTAIVDAPVAELSSESLENDFDPGWQRKNADACVHRQAYRLATSDDPAETVAKAVVEFCGGIIATSAIVNANDEVAKGLFTQDQRNQRADQIAANYEPFALSKVVEGRAGKCKA